jgi:hypothetical protein
MNLNSRGKYTQAQPLFEKALAICKKVLGGEHRDTARSYNNVAFNLNAQGKYCMAQPLYDKARSGAAFVPTPAARPFSQNGPARVQCWPRRI